MTDSQPEIVFGLHSSTMLFIKLLLVSTKDCAPVRLEVSRVGEMRPLVGRTHNSIQQLAYNTFYTVVMHRMGHQLVAVHDGNFSNTNLSRK